MSQMKKEDFSLAQDVALKLDVGAIKRLSTSVMKQSDMVLTIE
jgi:hypothetical protein